MSDYVNRLYLPGAKTTALTPAFGATWNQTASALRRQLSRYRQNEATANGTTITNTSSDVLHRQYVSTGLCAQNIAGTVTIMVQGLESAATADAFLKVEIRVYDSLGTTLRGTLLAATLGLTELDIALRTVAINTAALSALDVQAGDVLVVEIGVHRLTATSLGTTLRFGSVVGGTDMTEGDTTTTEIPWVEFSQALKFQATRFYFRKPTVKAPTGTDYAISLQGAWTGGSNANATAHPQQMAPRKSTFTAINDAPNTVNSMPVTTPACGITYVSDELLGQTIPASTARMQSRQGCSAAAGQLRLFAWVRKPDGTSRGNIIAATVSGTCSVASTNRGHPTSAGADVAVSTLAVLDGDRIVLELGFTVATAGETMVEETGLVGATTEDLPNDETTTTQLNAWFEMSADILFRGQPVLPDIVMNAVHQATRW